MQHCTPKCIFEYFCTIYTIEDTIVTLGQIFNEESKNNDAKIRILTLKAPGFKILFKNFTFII